MPLATIPTGYVVCWHPTCCGKVPAHVHINATDRYCIDCAIDTIHTATDSRPTAPVPPGYAVCRPPTCCVEVPAHVHIAATDRYCIDVAIHTWRIESIIPILIARRER